MKTHEELWQSCTEFESRLEENCFKMKTKNKKTFFFLSLSSGLFGDLTCLFLYIWHFHHLFFNQFLLSFLIGHINHFCFEDNRCAQSKITDVNSWAGLINVIFVIKCIDFFDKECATFLTLNEPKPQNEN